MDDRLRSQRELVGAIRAARNVHEYFVENPGETEADRLDSLRVLHKIEQAETLLRDQLSRTEGRN